MQNFGGYFDFRPTKKQRIRSSGAMYNVNGPRNVERDRLNEQQFHGYRDVQIDRLVLKIKYKTKAKLKKTIITL